MSTENELHRLEAVWRKSLTLNRRIVNLRSMLAGMNAAMSIANRPGDLSVLSNPLNGETVSPPDCAAAVAIARTYHEVRHHLAGAEDDLGLHVAEHGTTDSLYARIEALRAELAASKGPAGWTEVQA